MSIDQSVIRRDGVRVIGGSAEPLVSVESLVKAIEPREVELFRPLLPVGYAAGLRAYQSASNQLSVRDLTTHYTSGLDYFHDEFVPVLKERLEELSGGEWSFADHEAFAGGSDVDFMAHLVEAIAAKEKVALFPGDWFGFRVGCTQVEKIQWDASGHADLACLCIPSVRNGHVSAEMNQFLRSAESCLINLNLYPTLSPPQRKSVAEELSAVLPKSVLSISFSRGFGLTASQLGVVLVPKSHPYCLRFRQQWDWFTYFYNRIAAQAFVEFDMKSAAQVDRARAKWVQSWLRERELPCVSSGSYYVKAFTIEQAAQLPEYLNPLCRDNVVRLCFKPPQV